VRVWLALSVALAAIGLVFVWPAWSACGAFPAPLDDVYIHADFARALAKGHPFEWIAGNGYSSGETAPLYPFLLAPGVWLGLDDERLVAFAFAVAALSLGGAGLAIARTYRRLGLGRHAPWAALATLALMAAIGTVSFTFFSGMEAAAFFGATAFALDAADEARARVASRARATRRLGVLGAAMVLLRPEGLVVVLALALVAARGARTRAVAPALARAAGPALAVTGLVLLTNRALTGDFASAGARLKLLGSNPFLDDVSRAKELVLNLLTLYWKALAGELGAAGLAGCAGLVAVGLASRATRHACLACLVGALAFALLVSTNGAARYQGLRYYAPAIGLFVVAAGLGAARIGLVWPRFAVLAPLAIAASCAPRFFDARDYFRRASANVHGQQVEMGKRIDRELPAGARVLVGDAGAIPFFSHRPAIDALGLGGYARRPFVRAAVHGEASTLELLERLPPAERPTHLALYPNWFPRTTALFGVKRFDVTIDDNVICGGPTKGLYEARWDALGGGDAVDLGFPPAPARAAADSLDLADVESEESHRTALPFPNSGYPVAAVLRVGPGAPRFDGGRVVGPGREISFEARGLGPRAPRALVVRGDDAGFDVTLRATSGAGGRLRAESAPSAFTHADLTLPLGDGDRVTLVAEGFEARLFHVWIASP